MPVQRGNHNLATSNDHPSRRDKKVERGRRSQARLGRKFEETAGAPRRLSRRTKVGWALASHHYRVIGAIALVALLVVVGYISISDNYWVWDADIIGARWTPRDEIWAAAGIDGLSIFYIDPLSVAENIIKKLPTVQQAQVTCKLPHKVTITVVERTPVAIWQNQQIQYWVDASGFLFPRMLDITNPVIIVEQGASTRVAGDRVDLRALQTALDINRLTPEVRIFAYAPDDGLSFDIPNGPRVLLPVGYDAQKAVGAIRSLQEYAEQRRIPAGVIDLRYEKRAFLR